MTSRFEEVVLKYTELQEATLQQRSFLKHFDGKVPHLQAVIMTVNNINKT